MPAETRIKSHRQTVGVASSVLLGNDPRREALILSQPDTGRVSFAFGEAAVLDGGVTLHAGGSPITLTYAQLGEAIRDTIHGIADASHVVGMVEVYSP